MPVAHKNIWPFWPQVTSLCKGAGEEDSPRDWRGDGNKLPHAAFVHGHSEGKRGCSVGVIRSCMQQWLTVVHLSICNVINYFMFVFCYWIFFQSRISFTTPTHNKSWMFCETQSTRVCFVCTFDKLMFFVTVNSERWQHHSGNGSIIWSFAYNISFHSTSCPRHVIFQYTLGGKSARES